MITVATDGVTDVADGLRAFPALPMPQIVSEAHDLRKFTQSKSICALTKMTSRSQQNRIDTT